MSIRIDGTSNNVSGSSGNLAISAAGTVGSAGSSLTSDGANVYWSGGFAAGTTIVFYQASAPTGWTQVITHTNKSLRVVNGTGGGSGGTYSFTDTFTNRAVPLPQHAHSGNTGYMSANHAHDYAYFNPGNGGGFRTSGGNYYNGFNTNYTGGVTADHYHGFTTDQQGTAGATMDFTVQYVDVIMCSKAA
jgi:hypothetical protein